MQTFPSHADICPTRPCTYGDRLIDRRSYAKLSSARLARKLWGSQRNLKKVQEEKLHRFNTNLSIAIHRISTWIVWLRPTPNSSKVALLPPHSECGWGKNRVLKLCFCELRILFVKFICWASFPKRPSGNRRPQTSLRVLSLTLRLSSRTRRAAAVAHAALTSCWAPARREKRIQTSRGEEVRKRGRLLRGRLKKNN